MNPFKICTKCDYTWRAIDDFLKDPTICLVGFQAKFNKNESGLYLFNHILEENRCDTTLAVDVEEFLSLYKGIMSMDIKFESPQCEGHCSRVEDLSRCRVECKNAVAREIMQAFPKCGKSVKR